MEQDVRLSAPINNTGGMPHTTAKLEPFISPQCNWWRSYLSVLGLLTEEHELKPDVTVLTGSQFLL